MKNIGIAGLTLTLLTAATPAMAYIGPGAGVTVIGAALAMLATIAVVIFSLIWYPVRRLRGKRKRQAEDRENKGIAGEENRQQD